MKLLVFIIPVLLGMSSPDIVQLGLPVEVEPIRSVSTRENPVWDVSAVVEEADEFPECSYIIYGDTLISETIQGVRRWYSMSPEGCAFLREESLLHSCEPPVPLPTQVFPNVGSTAMSRAEAMSGTESGYSSGGISMRDFSLGRKGVYVSHPSVDGLLVVAGGDTVAATMTTEEFRYSETMSPSMPAMIHERQGQTAGRPDNTHDTPGDNTYMTVVRIRRWFSDNGSVLPVAVQAEAEYPAGAEYVTALSPVAFRAGNGELALMKEASPGHPGPATAAILKEASVGASGGAITITTRNATPLEILVAVASDGGIPYAMETRGISADTPVVIDTSGYPPGRYVVSLSCGDMTEKRLVTVN